ncbi:bifunctional DNA primase/polymerase [Aeoliella sp. ICT_H6.2]|uniref:Bifunctional DNA primase/polymerase n=1 Tax=Aeoliella straminimaris TaxID=2954799 RepID=A0A9X2F966_9BACT|nr:bifunctional DNA primase/polymerase [Aeoliella straminimaris]MCO6044690.1 bifunctional DNA primase/polymerase [Aeoliella straminimaris]
MNGILDQAAAEVDYSDAVSEKHQAAIEYAQNGDPVFPCVENGKPPACEHGCKDATTDLATIHAWWSENPEYNIGRSTDGLLVVDVDGKSNPWLYDIGSERQSELLAAPHATTPNDGLHFVFRQPDGANYRNTTGHLAEKVDTRANGGYIVVAPSTIDGREYLWRGQDGELPPFDQLPVAPAWLLDALAASDKKPKQRKAGTDGAAAVRGSMPVYREGERNDALYREACSLANVVKSPGVLEAALQRTNAERCQPPLPPAEVSRIANSAAEYIGAGGNWPTAQPAPAVVEPDEAFPTHLLHPGGLLEEIIEYHLATAYRPDRGIAFSAALALVSTILGRKVVDDWGTRPNLYIVQLAPQGAGKDAGRLGNEKLLIEAGAEWLLLAGDIASATGLEMAIRQHGVGLLQIDEAGDSLQAMMGQGAAPHIAQAVAVLKKLYTSSGGYYRGKCYANQDKNPTIVICQPYLTAYLTATEDQFKKSLQAASVLDGFMSRLGVFEAANKKIPYTQSPQLDYGRQSIVGKVKAWVDYQPGGNLSSTSTGNPAPVEIPSLDGAVRIFAEHDNRCTDLANNDRDAYRGLWCRAHLNARKFALIHACSLAGKPAPKSVAAESAKWGCELSDYLTRQLVAIARDDVAESPFDADCKKVVRFLKGRKGRATGDQVRRALRHLSKRDRAAVIETMEEDGRIGRETQYPNGPGRPATVYYLAAERG